MEPKRFLSLGAGVQSSTLALMIAKGQVPPVEAAIFADTGAEPQSVYRWLDWLEAQLPFKVHRVFKGNLRDELINAVQNGTRTSNPPFFTANRAMLFRNCTRDFKIAPLKKAQKALAGKKVPIITLIGISLDEVQRMKPSRDKRITHEYPLIDMRITRDQCIEWMKSNGYPEPPKSACTFCPYRNVAGWRKMRDTDPEAFADAVAIDKLIRNGLPGTKEKLFVHRSLVPLDEVDLRTQEEREKNIPDQFGNECEGMCGV